MTTSITTSTSTEAGLDPSRFLDAVGHDASGITIITGQDDQHPIGFTCHPSRGGNPVLDGTLAWLDCTIARNRESWTRPLRRST